MFFTNYYEIYVLGIELYFENGVKSKYNEKMK